MQGQGVYVFPLFGGDNGEGKEHVLMVFKGHTWVEVVHISFDKFCAQCRNGEIEK